MGGLLNGIGQAIGGPFGAVGGGAADAAGATSDFQASNPYAKQYLEQMVASQSQIGAGQNSLAAALQAQMAGAGPNPAQLQYQANLQNNLANAQGLIASQRGLNPALAARMGANIAAQNSNQGALGSALIQQQQQLGATQALGNLYGQMQSGNLGYQQLYNQANMGAAGLNQQTASQNAKIRGDITGGFMQGVAGMGSKIATGGAAAHGGMVAGKAKVPGDSVENDTVNVNLSPGEIVIPRSHAKDAEKAKEFIDHLLKSGKKSKTEYKDVLAARKKRAS